MSITKSYNKHTGTYYAYETTYEWSDEKQKKVQHKRCIGQFDPETGKVIPNGKVGRPSLLKQRTKIRDTNTDSTPLPKISNADLNKIMSRLEELEIKASSLSEEIHCLIKELNASVPKQDI